MKSLHLFFLIFFLSEILVAQNKVFLDENNNWTKAEDATQYAIITNESKQGIKVETFTLEGIKKTIEYYSKFSKKRENQIKNGVFRALYPNGTDSLAAVYTDNQINGQLTILFPNGEKKMTTNYKDGLLNGTLLQYHPNGEPKRKEQYEKGSCIGGVLLDEKGNSLPFYPYFQQSEFPGGVESLMIFLNQNIQYPVYSIRNGEQGCVLVDFIINKDGTMEDISLLKSCGHSLLDKEALRLVSVMQKTTKWTSCLLDGQPARIRYTLPVIFRLKQ